MPQYQWQEDENVAPCPKRITDGNGKELHRLLWIDTDTGMLERYLVDENEKYVKVSGIPFILKEKAPLPITIEWNK